MVNTENSVTIKHSRWGSAWRRFHCPLLSSSYTAELQQPWSDDQSGLHSLAPCPVRTPARADVVAVTRCTSITRPAWLSLAASSLCPGLLGNSSQLTTGLRGHHQRERAKHCLIYIPQSWDKVAFYVGAAFILTAAAAGADGHPDTYNPDFLLAEIIKPSS